MPKSRSLRTMTISTNAPPRRDSLQGGGPPSPTFSESTNVSAMNFGENGPRTIITRVDLRSSMQAYENLLNTCSNYEAALLTMSRATAAFADAMQVCSSLKGPTYEQATRLQASSGMHHLMGNHWHVLSETLEQNFEKPLRQHLDAYRSIVNERSASYEKVLRDKSNIIRDLESRNFNVKNRNQRNMQTFREALVTLQRQIDALDDLKARHYEEIIEHEEQVWDVVQGKVCLVVRSTMDVFDRFTAKASDPVIEPMLQQVPDPFDVYDQPSSDQIFSILPPLSILAPSPSVTSSAAGSVTGTPKNEHVDTWTHTAPVYADGGGMEWADATSPSASPPPPPSPPSALRSPSPRSVTQRSASPSGSSRRAEPKLRSVLAVIDEARTRPPAQPSPAPATSSSWFSFPFSDHPREDSSDTLTPRNSTFFPADDPAPGPGDYEGERERSGTPQSDGTAHAVAVAS